MTRRVLFLENMSKSFSRKALKSVLLLFIIAVCLNGIYKIHKNGQVMKTWTLGYKNSEVYYYNEKDGLAVVMKRSKRGETESSREKNDQVDWSKVRVVKSIDEYREPETTMEEPKEEGKGILPPMTRFEEMGSFEREVKMFFKDLFSLMEECKPKIDGINNDDHYRDARNENKQPNREGRIPLYGGHLRENYKEEDVRTKKMLSYYLRLSKEEKEELKRAHGLFLSKMPKEFPEELLSHKNFPLMKGDGILYLGGGRYNQLLLTSLKVLRDSGSKLPVEVVLPQALDFNREFCDKILKVFDASCRILLDFIPEDIAKGLTGYQYKSLALLISSFERILYLDADNFVINKVDEYFVNAPFTESHMVLWPDLWRRSTSPHFYDIAGITVHENKKERESYFIGDERRSPNIILYHDSFGALPEASSETGQTMINKRVHFRTLVLTMYYNFFGPNYYYPLLSQGAAGEGDKETLIAAAHGLKLPYYQVQEFDREFGPMKGNSKHELFGMGQYDPIVDYFQQQESEVFLNRGPLNLALTDSDDTKSNYNYHLYTSSRLLFLHANWPKLYLREFFLDNAFGRGVKVGDDRRRLYGHELKEFLNGYDFELVIMKAIEYLYCSPFSIEIEDVPDASHEDRSKICDEVHAQVKFLAKL